MAAVVTIVPLAGCSADAPGGGEDGTDGGPASQACADPGSPLLDSTKPAELPVEGEVFGCGTGWGTDAPQLDPTWTVELPLPYTEYGIMIVTVDAHPEGGTVIAGTGLFARYDEDGDEVWSDTDSVPLAAEVQMVVEADGSIVLASYDWVNDADRVARFAADGSLIGPVAIPWNSVENSEVWGFETHGTELLVGAVDTDAEGSWENTLLRLDAADELILRKSTNLTNNGQLAINETGSTVLFGALPSFLLAIDSGAVQATVTPSIGGSADFAGLGDDFVMAGSGNGDLTVGRYSALGVERWLQTYDRAALGDNGRAIAVGPDQAIVAVGTTSLLNPNGIYWFGTQPLVVGVDADGNATWSDRISAVGEATGVTFGAGGEVYVVGVAEGVMTGKADEPVLVGWMRRYDL